MSIHAMSDDEFEEFDSETHPTPEELDEACRFGLCFLEFNPQGTGEDDEDNYDDHCDFYELSSDLPHPEDIGFDPETDCQNPF